MKQAPLSSALQGDGSDGARSRQKSRLGPQPITDDPRPLLPILRPGFGKAIVGDFVALDTKRVLNDLGGATAIVGADFFFKQVGHACTPRKSPAEILPKQDGQLPRLHSPHLN